MCLLRVVLVYLFNDVNYILEIIILLVLLLLCLIRKFKVEDFINDFRFKKFL